MSQCNAGAQTPVQIWTFGGLGLRVCSPQSSPRVTEWHRPAPIEILSPEARTPPLPGTSEDCQASGITAKQLAGQRTGASVSRGKADFFSCLPKWRRGRDMCCESGCVLIFWWGWGRRRVLLFNTSCMGVIVEIFKKLIIYFSFARN